jgi:hypothetical protein
MREMFPEEWDKRLAAYKEKYGLVGRKKDK